MNFRISIECSENITPPFGAGQISGHYPCISIINQSNNFLWGRGGLFQGRFTWLLYFSRNDIFSGFCGYFFSNCIFFIFIIGSGFCSWILRIWNCSSCLLASCLSSLLAASVGRTSPQSWPLLRMMTGWLLSSLSQLGYNFGLLIPSIFLSSSCSLQWLSSSSGQVCQRDTLTKLCNNIHHLQPRP